MLHVDGNTFDTTAKEKFNKLKKGDVVLIYSIEFNLEILGKPKHLRELKVYIE